jgi:hypothetical protein
LFDHNDARLVLDHQMAVIVKQLAVSVEQLADLRQLPSVQVQRPSSCPVCGQPAYPPGEALGIVGHGTYTRQVLGLVDLCGQVVIWVRRYLCRGCGRTISVLPDGLYPGRWYAGAVMVVSLFLSLLKGWSAADVRQRCGGIGTDQGWKTLRRWQRHLLCPLWGWWAGQLGIDEQPASTRDEQRRRLSRLLGLHGVGPPNELSEVEATVPLLVQDTAHIGADGWSMARARRGDSS